MRDQLHPLHRLRDFAWFRVIEGRIDIPVWGRLRHIDWPVRVRLMRHLSYLVLRESPERGVTVLIRLLAAEFHLQRMWDVGANFGYYAWLAASQAPHLSVTMFEPDPSNAELIEATMSRSRRGGVTLHRVAASSSEGQAEFAVDAVSGAAGTLEGAEHAYVPPARRAGMDTITVRTVTLDSVAHERPVDLLKVDVEGHEDAVFAGATAILREDRPLIIFESMGGPGPLIKRLENIGYIIFDADSAGAPAGGTENFFALPAERERGFEDLVERWRREVA